ncbi:MAG: hypothetical protein EXR35_10030 [Limnohabitans sp.]|nr:hypothetical protein [Limnohabitans sp.]
MSTKKIPNAQLTHFGLYCQDLDSMVEFYQRTLGLVKTDGGDYYVGGQIMFLSRNANEHHQLVLASGRPEDSGFSPINQISFRVDNLEDLCTFYAQLIDANVQIQRTMTHGNAWSIYFFDPEGNRVELYTPSPWYVNQPFAEPVDMSQSAESLMRQTEDMLRENPSKIPIEIWSERLQKRLQG